MDVTTINNPIQSVDYNRNVRVAAAPDNSQPADISNKSEFDYAQAMMDLEDVKNFLFMCIGGDISRISADENRGRKVDSTV